MQTAPGHIYEFGPFQLDPGKRLLQRLDGTTVPLTSRVFETLLYMVEHHDAVLNKERIMEAIWPDSIVEENNLAQNISTLRHVFGERPGSHSYIVTVPGRGYRFVAQVNKRTADAVKSETVNGRTGETANSQPTSGLAGSPEKPEFVEGLVSKPREVSGLPAKTGWLWAAAVSAIALVSLAAVFFVRHRSLSASVRAPSSLPPGNAVLSAYARIPEKSIAVLPFENLSDDKQNAYFAAGVQDEIISDLAKIADLKVISRTSANLYKSGNARNSREIGQQLGVAHLLEGAIQRIGSRVRINVQLVEAHTDTHVWAQIYDRDVADLFAIQSEIATAIADELHAKISPAEKLAIERPPTTDLAAFDLYTRAKNIFLAATNSNSGKEDLLEAADLLNQALARDPSYFEAYCQLGGIHDLLYILGHDHSPRRLSLAQAAVDTALRLRPNAGEAHLARATHLYSGYLNYDAALAELEVARKSLPNDCRVFELAGLIQNRRGKFEEALPALERTVELDPRNVYRLEQVATLNWPLRRYPEAREIYDRALAIEPNNVQLRMARADLDLAWKADTRAVHRVIESLRENNPRAIHQIADSWVSCALADRDPTAAKAALIAAGENTPLNDNGLHFNRSFVEGWIARLEKDEPKARVAFESARAEQEKIVQRQPDYAPSLCVLGVIDAALGRKQEALSECRHAVELLPVEKDAFNGQLMIHWFAISAAWVGEKDLACEQLAAAVRYPGGPSYGQLKLMPWWDPLRGDPRFEQIVASLAPNGELTTNGH
jgi:TolB-like protein/DNA-binding winged helix-turn-helix (wHTH) protein/Tfp pilus assembly protein PilF